MNQDADVPEAAQRLQREITAAAAADAILGRHPKPTDGSPMDGATPPPAHPKQPDSVHEQRRAAARRYVDQRRSGPTTPPLNPEAVAAAAGAHATRILTEATDRYLQDVARARWQTERWVSLGSVVGTCIGMWLSRKTDLGRKVRAEHPARTRLNDIAALISVAFGLWRFFTPPPTLTSKSPQARV